MPTRGVKSGYRRTIPLRRELRHQVTPAERLFWSKITNRQLTNLKFRRQHGIGNYIVDFYCPSKRLVVEIDGDTHATDDVAAADRERSRFLTNLGYTVIRYNNRDVINNIEGVFEDFMEKLGRL